MTVNGNPSDDWKFREAYGELEDWEMWKEHQESKNNKGADKDESKQAS